MKLTTLLSGFLSVAALATTSTVAGSAVWHVERNGSGDFTALQPAVSAAAAGDTILVGPGRYTETTLVGPTAAYVHLNKPDLRIIGTDRGSVVIGPESPSFDPANFSPVGVFGDPGIACHLESLTVEHAYRGFWPIGPSVVSDCEFRECDTGIIFGAESLVVEGSSFVDNEAIGLAGIGASTVTRLVDNIFLGNRNGITLRGGSTEISSCIVEGGRVGIQLDAVVGTVERCTVRFHDVVGINAISGANALLVDNVASGNSVGIQGRTFAHLTGNGNLVQESTLAAVRCQSQATAEFNNNEILSPPGTSAVRAEVYQFETITLDFENNYWGTLDPAEIADLIHDGNDDPTIRAFVDFEPFAMEPIPVRASSFGELKALFGPGRE